MTDHRDLPLEIARRAAERGREGPDPRTSFRFRERRPPAAPPQARSWTWLWGVGAVAVLAIVLVLLLRPVADDGRSAPQTAAPGGPVERAPAPADPAPARSTPSRERVDALMVQADAARRAGRLDGDAAAALPLYREVLRLQPGHVAALRGEADTLAALGAASARKARDREQAAGPATSPDTPARSTADDGASRQRAEQDLRSGRLQQAAEGFRALRSTDEAAAEDGLSRVAEAHATRAQRLAADFEFDEAEAELGAARALGPETAAVREATQRLERARLARARAPAIDADRQGRVRSLLEQASAAIARGDLLDPPGDSAFDKVAAARALAPNAPEVRAVERRLESARQARGEGSPPP